MGEEKVLEKGAYIRISNKDGKDVLARSFIPAGSKIFFEEIEKPPRVPWEGTLFNMGVMVRDKVYIGHVVREAEGVIVVFADAGRERWDIPKKNIKVTGKNVFCDITLADLNQCEVSRNSPLPPSI